MSTGRNRKSYGEDYRTQVNYSPTPEHQKVMAQGNIQVQRAMSPQTNQLLEMLGKDRPEYKQITDKIEKKKLEEQEKLIDYYVETLRSENNDEAVSAAQAGKRFPETVPSIRMTIAETMGKRHARQFYAKVQQEILTREDLKDPDARAQFLRESHAEFMRTRAGGDPFYLNGAFNKGNALFEQFEHSIIAQRSKEQTSLLIEEYQEDQGAILRDPGLTQSEKTQGLLSLDATHAKKNVMSDEVRRDVGVDTVIKVARAEGRPELLDTIPGRYRTVENNAKIEQAREQLNSSNMTKMRHKWAQDDRDKAERLFEDKTAMLQQYIESGSIDPAKAGVDRNGNPCPDRFAFASQLMGSAHVDAVTSAAQSQQVRDDILSGYTLGGQQMSTEQLRASILSRQDLNPQDKLAILKDLPELQRGYNLLNSPEIREAFSMHLAPVISDSNAMVAIRLERMFGKQWRMSLTRMWEGEFRAAYTAHRETHGQWPVGIDAYNIREKILDKMQKLLEEKTDIRGMGGGRTQGPTPRPPTENPEQPTAPPQEPRGRRTPAKFTD